MCGNTLKVEDCAAAVSVVELSALQTFFIAIAFSFLLATKENHYMVDLLLVSGFSPPLPFSRDNISFGKF